MASPSSLIAPLGRSLRLSCPSITRHARCFAATPSACGRRSATPVASKTSPASQQTKNPFVAPPNSVLAYVGPYSRSLHQAKSVAFVFGACGCIAVPATLLLGNTEHLLAVMAGVASLSPSLILHALFRNDVKKIFVQGSVSPKTPAAITVSTTDALRLTIEKLSWRGAPLQSQVLSTKLFVQSETDKSVIWTTTAATTPAPPPSARGGARPPSQPRKETYRVDKRMMLSNPSFSFVMDQIEHQSRLSRSKHNNEHGPGGKK